MVALLQVWGGNPPCLGFPRCTPGTLSLLLPEGLPACCVCTPGLGAGVLHSEAGRVSVGTW